jgi:Raf kinase inhibitor-like YbhB/YbcL family protein
MRSIYIFFLVVAILVEAGCTAKEMPASEGEGEMVIQVTSTAFSEGGNIPRKYTCDDINVSPQLSWTGVPQGTKSLALIADDPDAPAGTWVHWVLFNLSPELGGLDEGAMGLGVNGKNDFRKLGYGGPCPPKGSAHRYYFKLYALDTILNLKEGATKADVEKAMKGHVLAWGQVMGKYSR